MSQRSTSIWKLKLILPKSMKRNSALPYILHYGLTVCSEQCFDSKSFTRHSKTIWIGLNQAVLSFGKIECTSI